jgi:hypothetical protein
MNISKLYQRAHALRMEDKEAGVEETPPEFYVGAALGESIIDFYNPDKDAVVPREKHIRFVVRILRGFACEPKSIHMLLVRCLAWPGNDIPEIWKQLLRTYGERPRLLLAIADGMEA